MRDTAQQVAKDVEKVKKIQSDILSAPTVDPKSKAELEDAMTGIKKMANMVRIVLALFLIPTMVSSSSTLFLRSTVGSERILIWKK